MMLYKCDKCGKIIEKKKELYQMTISLYDSGVKNSYDICEECFYDYIKDFESGKIFVK